MMKEVFELFSELAKQDIEWIFSEGNELQVIANTQITEEGKFPDAIYILLKGLLGVRVSTIDTTIIGSLSPGEIIAEMAFLEKVPASANVFAQENSLLLAISYNKLENKIEEDPKFASRLYRSFAIMNARRLKDRIGTLGQMLGDKKLVSQQASSLWDEVSPIVTAFVDQTQQADKEALQNNDVVSEETTQKMVNGFLYFLDFVNEKIGDHVDLHQRVKDDIGARIKREILPYVLLTQTAERFYSKPRGYAGDYLTIEMIYQNTPTGSGRIGSVLDKCFLETGPSKAVRNRRGLLSKEIMRIINEKDNNATTKIVSLASGPAAEVFDVFSQLDDPSKLLATLVDIDFEALAFVSNKIEKKKLRKQIKLVNGNLVYLATGRQVLDVKDPDLVYSVGLIDYFNDQFVIALMNYVYNLLKPGGKIILGNFHSSNTAKPIMDHVFDWKLIHRTEEEMHRLFSASSFKRTCSKIQFEEAGVNLFAECIKA